MNIVEHAEKFLGKISQGWIESATEKEFQIVCFKNAPVDGVNTFMTLGLSCHELKISNEKTVRQELILPLSNEAPYDVIVSLLLFICELIITDHRAVLRGQVLRLPVDAIKNFGFEGVYFTIPVFMDDRFSVFEESRPPTVIVWAIPIYKSEADYVNANGWSKFEELLEEKSPDLFSFRRRPLV